ncbi:glutaredoxin family protein [Domibacillus sp. A3M-37]|uniref:glutaredoxin family protein n=1 Tax=Domibacillus sp. A3M-37 TaxID=2962037 RepID=UPI0020B7292B|nr:glutaredoxin family protein [Domibacillus sp. A3M-37]MCP3761130.1 glutaredoxin family protein [Domibacillus sp. A3M-37]
MNEGEKMDVYFYTRPGCHLCDEAKAVVGMVAEEFSLTVLERNIEENDEWTEKYGLMIPVVEAAGEMIAYGRADYVSIFMKLKQKVNK